MIMQSPLNESSQFLPSFGHLPSKMVWNGSETNSLPFPPFPQPTAFPFPYQIPPQIFTPPTAFLNMLAAQERIGINPPHIDYGSFHSIPMFPRMADERNNSSIVPCSSPITPPLTPMVSLTPLVMDHPFIVSTSSSSTSTAAAVTDITTTGSTATPLVQPTRVSSRSRRPPAFIEGESACPLCGTILRASDLAEHYVKELEALTSELNRTTPNTTTGRKRDVRVSSRISEKKAHLLEESRKNVLTRVQHNRKTRAARSGAGGKRRKMSGSPSSTSSPPSHSAMDVEASTSAAHLASTSDAPIGTACPVCNEILSCSSEGMTEHVENCLSKQTSDGSNQDGSDSEGECETYTWCGKTRVRATSFLDSTELAASGFDAVKREEEDETPVIVDDDLNAQQFGEAQYSEADIIPCTSEEPAEAKAQSALRNAVISLTGERNGTEITQGSQSKWTGDNSVDDHSQPLRCLICMDRYSNPLVSVQCWHVHCEECWLRTLGAKKLCPQCNMITSPSDLRRIYL